MRWAVTSELQRDIDILRSDYLSREQKNALDRIEARLAPNRERVARAIAKAVDGDGELPWQTFLSEADAAIAAMGETK